MAHLLHEPEKMEKLRAEISAALASKDFVEESDLNTLPTALPPCRGEGDIAATPGSAGGNPRGIC